MHLGTIRLAIGLKRAEAEIAMAAALYQWAEAVPMDNDCEATPEIADSKATEFHYTASAQGVQCGT